jgi:hypothetical protein
MRHRVPKVMKTVLHQRSWMISASSSSEGDEDRTAPTELDEAEIRRLVATLGVPRARLEEMLANNR